MTTKTSALAGGGVEVGMAVFLNEGLAVDVNSKGLRFLKSGTVEIDPNAFDTNIFTAKDLFNSTARTSSFGSTSISVVDFDNSTYVAGGVGKLATSTDGINWTQQSINFASSTIRGLGFGAGLFVAAGDSGKLSTSPTGVTWTPRTSSFGASIIRSVNFNNSLFIATGSSSTLATSTDGINWLQRTNTFSSNVYWSAFGAGLFVAVGDNGDVETSPTGVTWTPRTSNFGTTDIFSIAFGNGIFVIVGFSGKMATSTDGITWTLVTSSFGSTPIRALDFANGVFVAVGDSNKIAVSTNGTDWKQVTTVATVVHRGVSAGGPLVVSGGDSGEMVTYEALNFAGSTVAFSEFGEDQYVRIS